MTTQNRIENPPTDEDTQPVEVVNPDEAEAIAVFHKVSQSMSNGSFSESKIRERLDVLSKQQLLYLIDHHLSEEVRSAAKLMAQIETDNEIDKSLLVETVITSIGSNLALTDKISVSA